MFKARGFYYRALPNAMSSTIRDKYNNKQIYLQMFVTGFGYLLAIYQTKQCVIQQLQEIIQIQYYQ